MTVATLSIQNDYVHSSNGNSSDFASVLRLCVFALRARKKGEARMTRMRIAGRIREVSATHYGDVRIGCTLIHCDEIIKINIALRKPVGE